MRCDGTFFDMDARLKVFEDGMKEIKGDLKTLFKSTARIDGSLRETHGSSNYFTGVDGLCGVLCQWNGLVRSSITARHAAAETSIQ